MRIALTGTFCICLLAIQIASADLPATQPATTQPVQLAAKSPIRKWFAQLADSDPEVRDQAKLDLMGIKADDLPGLRQLVMESQPISPSQLAALHDIVIQAYLASQKYQAEHGETDASGTVGPFFLGIRWAPTPFDPPRLGVAVEERLPGFPGYRYLRTGDMILGIYKDPDKPFDALPNLETHNRDSLIIAINPPGGGVVDQDIVLQVLRDGQTLKIALKMAPRPFFPEGNNQDSLNAFITPRLTAAEAYWQDNFVPMLGEKFDASNLAEGR